MSHTGRLLTRLPASVFFIKDKEIDGSSKMIKVIVQGCAKSFGNSGSIVKFARKGLVEMGRKNIFLI